VRYGAGCDVAHAWVYLGIVTFAIDTARPAVLFPGQGSQTPGMRDAVKLRASDLLERCIELVGEDPFARVDESTRFAQPAIFCASLSAWEVSGVEPGVAAGHSLGELAALTAAGAIAGDDALELVVLRGRLMAEADPDGSMIALIGGTPEDAEAVAERSGVTVANDNAPGQIVLSGPRDALARAEQVAGELGRRTLPVDVAGAFHSPSMRPAVEPFRAALDAVEVREPRFPVVSCATARPFEDVRAELAGALVRPVRWRETMLALHAAGARTFVETGPGKLLARMGKRILPDCPVAALEDQVHA
jgi:[acyl-carrier-protein] S-malonyltransferase